MRFSDYELVRHLGLVPGRDLWLAEQRREGVSRKVVVARLGRAESTDPRMVEAFIDATRRQATLDHPHIARVFDIGYADGQFYYCRPWIEGASIRELLLRLASRGRTLPIEHALLVAGRVARAIAAAHGSHVIHGSLSSRRVVVSRAGEVVVTGPWAGDRPGRAADVAAVADLLFELISGAPAASHRRPRLSAIAPEVPPRLDALVERARELDIETFAAELSAIASGLERSSSPEALASWLDSALTDRAAMASRRPVAKFREVATEVRPQRLARGSVAPAARPEPPPTYARLPVVVRPRPPASRRPGAVRKALVILAIAVLGFAASTTITMALQ